MLDRLSLMGNRMILLPVFQLLQLDYWNGKENLIVIDASITSFTILDYVNSFKSTIKGNEDILLYKFNVI